MWFYIIGAIVILIIGLLLYAYTKPDEFRIERSTAIKATPEQVFTQLNNFKHWLNWSPWEKLDPNLKRDFSGPESGVGAVYDWQGNKKVGKGRMEIIESSEPGILRVQLDFIEPFAANNIAEFSLQQTDNTTHINWAMTGKHVYMWKVMGLLMNMDKMVGKNFEDGLSNLKQLCEATTTR
jgi:carbon monoxide dehydrogenase subunit G